MTKENDDKRDDEAGGWPSLDTPRRSAMDAPDSTDVASWSGQSNAASGWDVPRGPATEVESGWGGPSGSATQPGWGSPQGDVAPSGWAAPQSGAPQPEWGAPQGGHAQPGWGAPQGGHAQPGWGAPQGGQAQPGWGSPQGGASQPGWGAPQGGQAHSGWGSPQGGHAQPGWGAPQGGQAQPGWGSPQGGASQPGWGAPQGGQPQPGWHAPQSANHGWAAQGAHLPAHVSGFAGQDSSNWPQTDPNPGGLAGLFSARGRLGRLAYFVRLMSVLFVFVSMIVGLAVMSESNEAAFGAFVIVFLVGIVVMTWASICLQIRRLHDLGKPGWWVLLGFVPLVNYVFPFYLLFAPGTGVPNEHGPPPRDS